MTCFENLNISFAFSAAAVLWGVCAIILFWVRRNNRFAGHSAFVLTLLAMLWWLFAVVFELASQSEACKIGWALAAWPGIVLLPIAWMFFVFDHTMTPDQHKHPVRVIYYIVLPCIVSAVALTNSHTELLYKSGTRLIDDGQMPFVDFDHGPLFFAIAASLYIFVTSALVILGYAFVKAQKPIRPYLGLIFLITAAPLVANVAYVIWDITVFGFDPTPFLFAVSLILLSWLILNNSMMDTAVQGRNLLYYATHDPVILMSKDGLFVGANPAARDLFNSQIPKTGEPLDHLEMVGSWINNFLKIDQINGTDPIRLAGRIFDPRVFPIEHPIQTKNPILGWSLSLVDITEREHSAEALREALSRAEAANLAKSQFLANVSHEIRTPLNGILGMASVLGETELGKEQRDYLQTIEASGQVLLTTIGDVLDLSKIEAGKMDLEDHPFVLCDAIEGARALFSASAAEKGLVLTAAVQEGLPKTIIGDGHRFRQVLHNLVSNAIKFTETGAVTISAKPAENKDYLLLVQVADTGQGVPEKARQAIFQPFQQADAGDTRKFGGTGLGLSISRQLCHLMGGELRLVEGQTQGATFEIRIPLVSEPEAQVPLQEAKVSSEGASEIPAMDVLVVDDNKTNRVILQKFLSKTACRVHLVASGREAIESVKNKAFDVILMDIQMPKMNGMEATKAIRDVEQSKGRTPSFIVAVTANAMPEQFEEYLTAQMDNVLPKPVSKQQLLAMIAEHHIPTV